MPTNTGACTQLAFVKATDWDTPGLFASADLFPIVSEDISEQIERIANDELGGCVERGASDTGQTFVEGSFTRYLHYQGDELALALGMGRTVFVTGTPPNTLATFRENTLDGLVGTLFIDKQVGVWEVDVLKINSMEFTGGEGTPRVMVTYNILGKAYTSGGTEDFTTLTEPAANVNNFVLFRHLRYLVNDSAGAGLVDPTDNQSIGDFTITIPNDLETDFRNAQLTEEPTRTEFGDVTGAVTLTTYQDDIQIDRFLAQNLLKQRYAFASGVVDVTFDIDIPGAKFTSPSNPSVGGPGRVPVPLTWAGERTVAIPTGMTDTKINFFQGTAAADPLA